MQAAQRNERGPNFKVEQLLKLRTTFVACTLYMCKWFKEAWNSISEQTIVAGSHKARLILFATDGDVGELDISESEDNSDVPMELQPEVAALFASD